MLAKRLAHQLTGMSPARPANGRDILHRYHYTSQGLAGIRGPLIRNGRLSKQHDIRDRTATLYELANETPPEDLDGTSFMPQLFHNANEASDFSGSSFFSES